MRQLVEAASAEEAAAQGSRSFPHVVSQPFRATYHLVILRLFHSDAFYTLYFSEKKRSRVEEAIFMAEEKALVGIIMGSDSDLPVIEKAVDILKTLEIPYEVHIYSAHRTPVEARDFALNARENGFGVLIAAAGMAAHLAGAIAANTTLPVIGIPCKGPGFDGMDALLSTVQMPTGIPVATVAVNAGANAALLAAQIIAVSDSELQAKLDAKRKADADKVLAKDKDIAAKL